MKRFLFTTPYRLPGLLMVALLGMALLNPSPAEARKGPPEGYPKNFSWVGTIDGIAPKARRIVIRDALFLLDEEVEVHTPYARRATLSMVRPGMKVGVRLTPPDEQGMRTVTEIWVFPRGQKLMLPPPPKR